MPTTARSGTLPPAETELEHARRILSSKLTELKSLETERERLLSRISARDQRIRELEQKVARLAELEGKLAERDTEIARLKGELEETIAWQPPPEDDLTKIKGIGPKFASALHALGIHRYEDIAGWTDDDVARFAEALKVPRARIDKGGWVAAARALCR